MIDARVANAPRRPLRSAGAVLAGLASIVILATVVDTVLEKTGVFPSIADQRRNGFDIGWMLALALTYRFAFAIVGGYLTAALAPSRPTRHVAALMIIGFVLGSAGAVAVTDISPVWFAIAVIVAGVAGTWLGGRLTTAGRVNG